MDKNTEVTHFIENAPPQHRETLEMLRQLIEKSVPGISEQFKWKRPVYASKKDFCYMTTTKDYVTMGFYNYQIIDDPEKLLEGTGKQMRHIKIFSLSDIKAEVLIGMLKQSSNFNN